MFAFLIGLGAGIFVGYYFRERITRALNVFRGA